MRFFGLPNASYLGFTGTPIIIDEEELTKNIFGEYVSVYDFKRAIEDDATLPLLYINRGEKLGIDNPELDEKMAEIQAVREQLEDQETLAIFDLLRESKELQGNDLKQVKKVEHETLEKLKAKKLKIDLWREKREVKAQVKSEIYNQLLWLPQEVYTDKEVSLKIVTIYQHIYPNYYGDGHSVYIQ